MDSSSSKNERLGCDELNLAEFPLGLIDDQLKNRVRDNELIFAGPNKGTLTISGAKSLTTPTDVDVLMVLIAQTKNQTNFSDGKVYFRPYELIQKLRWSRCGDSYNRLVEAMYNWKTLSLHFHKCWWNARLRRYTTVAFSLLDGYEIVHRAEAGEIPGHPAEKEGEQPLSYFCWNENFLKSCQNGYLRAIDLSDYFSLKSPIARRLFRFLGKRFFYKNSWKFDLEELAFEIVGLSRSYKGDVGKLKQKLRSAIAELVKKGFLAEIPEKERYQKIGVGRWLVTLSKAEASNKVAKATIAANPSEFEQPSQSPGSPQKPLPVSEAKFTLIPPPPLHPVASLLVDRGIVRQQAERLVRKHSETYIQEKIAIFDWLRSQRQAIVANNPPGWLIASIEKNFEAPEGYQRQQKRHEQAQQRQQAQSDLHAEALQAEIIRLQTLELNQVIATMSPLDREQLKEAALKNTSDEIRKLCSDPGIGQMMLQTVMREELARRVH